MIEKSYKRIFDRSKFEFFRKVFELVRERDGSLTAMEAFSLEIIEMLDAPTIGRFADFLKISQSNATYKVNSLIRKGYLVRQNSDTDRREYHLILSEKYHRYMSLLTGYQDRILQKMHERFSERELQELDRMLTIIADELMEEDEVPVPSEEPEA